MKHISLPRNFTLEEIEPGKKAKVVIEPCFPGYGMTLGNALRRVLLSSLPGGAVTAVKIKGVQHEFSTIENVSEDVVDIILNLKQLNIKMHTDEPVVLKLKAKGEKKITASDIEHSSDAEVTNKDLHIATINHKDVEVEMDIVVAKGVGYVPVEDREKDSGEIGLILVDAIFTPVVNVGLDVQSTRVGKKTNYDKIILSVETDGSIEPAEAVKKSAEILVNQFTWVMEGGLKSLPEVDLEAPVPEPEIISSADIIDGDVSADDDDKVVENPVVVDDDGADDGDGEEVKTKKRGRPKKENKEE